MPAGDSRRCAGPRLARQHRPPPLPPPRHLRSPRRARTPLGAARRGTGGAVSGAAAARSGAVRSCAAGRAPRAPPPDPPSAGRGRARCDRAARARTGAAERGSPGGRGSGGAAAGRLCFPCVSPAPLPPAAGGGCGSPGPGVPKPAPRSGYLRRSVCSTRCPRPHAHMLACLCGFPSLCSGA